MTIIQTIAVWTLIALIIGMTLTAITHSHRRKQRNRRNQAILRNRYY